MSEGKPDVVYVLADENANSEYVKGWQAGYAAAKAEMLGKLNEFNPRYVEGGRVPEEAIEHRNGPKFKDMIETKGQ